MVEPRVQKNLVAALKSSFQLLSPGSIGRDDNLKTAKALGLTVPPMLLARADEVIE
jgi:hypothetical protein